MKTPEKAKPRPKLAPTPGESAITDDDWLQFYDDEKGFLVPHHHPGVDDAPEKDSVSGREAAPDGGRESDKP